MDSSVAAHFRNINRLMFASIRKLYFVEPERVQFCYLRRKENTNSLSWRTIVFVLDFQIFRLSKANKMSKPDTKQHNYLEH